MSTDAPPVPVSLEPVASPVRFELDTRNEKTAGLVRAASAVAVGGAAAWIVWLGPGMFGWILAILGGLAALGWIAAFRASRRRRAAGPERWFLELDREGLTLAEGHRRHQIAWRQVKHVEVDEDRLVVAVHRLGAPPLVLEPRYRNVGVYDLAEAVRRAHDDARGGAEPEGAH